MENEFAISAEGLVKRFKGRAGPITVLDGITLQVKRGETFGLIGPDGAGKSTTTRVILGLLRRDEGRSSVLGYDSMRDVYAIRSRSGYIAQQFALPADLTVMENMRFFADLHGLPAKQQKSSIADLLKLAGLTEFTSRPAGRLSGGMKKKLALACSLVHEPQVVLLDEPTLGVDPVSRREFWNLLGNLRAEKGTTIFVCTPYMDEAERCNQVGLIYKGRLIARDTPAGIKKQVPGRLLEFKPVQFEAAHKLVAGMPGILQVQTYGAMLHPFVDDLEVRQKEIEQAMAAQGITWSGMRAIEPRMEEAFINLVTQQEKVENA
ncbi:MAG: ABC transporter ATP-binding protein [Anaerolineales bacterium]|jgi:ABC-2 type transport system ATP-binding protein